ncbi:MAG TPA: Ku protein [Solirubrobacteraceae bacterium]|nr:Ku protein [Solirubrobacteraceae bacterium]
MAMPRSLWNGTIAFGLVRVPVKLHSATESKRIAFKERHAADGAAIEHRRVCVKEGKEVPYEEIVKGFEVSSGSYVVLDKQELAIADGPNARVVEVEHFVAEEQIDPIFYERAYYLSPGKLGEAPYRVLHAALLQTGKVGIGRFVFHNKEHLVAVRALPDTIAMQTMRFADEIVPESKVELPRARKQASKLELDTAQLLIDQLDAEFEPDKYEDAYREQLLALIERKAAGEAIEPPSREPLTPEADLLDVLKQSVERQGSRKRRAGGHGEGARAKRGEGGRGEDARAKRGEGDRATKKAKPSSSSGRKGGVR